MTSRNTFRRPRGSRTAVTMETFEQRILMSGITSYPITAFTPSGITSDNAGNQWIADGSGLYEIDSNGTQTAGPFAGPDTTGNHPSKIAFNSQNSLLYFTDPFAAEVVAVDLNGQVQHTYDMPNADTQSPQGVTVTADGGVWFTTSGSSNADGTLNNAQIGHIDLSNNLTFATPPDANTMPSQIASAADGSVWFETAGVSLFSGGVSTQLGGAEIGHAILNADGTIAVDHMYPINEPASFPGGLNVAGDGSLWFSMASDQGQDVGQIDGPDRIVHATLSDGSLLQTEYVLPGATTASTAFPEMGGIDSSGRVWFT
jgi:streptogramin lyase